MTLCHELHLFSDEPLLVEHLGLHLSDLLVLGDQLPVLHPALLLQGRDPLLELRDLPDMVSIPLPLPLGGLQRRRMEGRGRVMMVGVTVAVLASATAQTILQLGDIWPLGHLGVHVLLPLPLLLLAPLLLGLVASLFLEHAAVPRRVLLLRLGQRPLVAAQAHPAHELTAPLPSVKCTLLFALDTSLRRPVPLII